MPQEVPHREQGTGTSSERRVFLSDFHIQPEIISALCMACESPSWFLDTVYAMQGSCLPPDILRNLGAILHLDC